MSVNDRQTRGEISELEVAVHLIDKHRCKVSQIFGHSHPYDLVVDADGDLLKIQVKTVSLLQGSQVGRVLNNPDRYTPENVNLFAGQSKSEQEPFFVPYQEVNLEAGNPRIHVTYTPLEDMPTKRTREEAFHICDYRFEDLGTYEVTLTVTNPARDADSTTATVTVTDQVAPVALDLDGRDLRVSTGDRSSRGESCRHTPAGAATIR